MNRGKLANDIIDAIADGVNTSPRMAERLGYSINRLSVRLAELVRSGVLVRVGSAQHHRGKPNVVYALKEVPLTSTLERHHAEHTDITAQICGDPAPGRSALDMRQRSA